MSQIRLFNINLYHSITFYTKILFKTSSLIYGFQCDLIDKLAVTYFFEPPCTTHRNRPQASPNFRPPKIRRKKSVSVSVLCMTITSLVLHES